MSLVDTIKWRNLKHKIKRRKPQDAELMNILESMAECVELIDRRLDKVEKQHMEDDLK